ncbi:MAG: hypothetical protein U5K75_08585 [Ahrensia sp.]|nr:hypothetical protein [Ahrensia sp.]
MSLRVLFDTWPEGDFSKTLKDRFAEKSEEKIDVYLDTIFDAKERRWHMVVWVKDEENPIFKSQSGHARG